MAAKLLGLCLLNIFYVKEIKKPRSIKEWCHQEGKDRNPEPQPFMDTNHLATIHEQKMLWRAHVFDFSKPVERENTKKNHRSKEGRTTSCFLHSPAPRLAQLSAEKKLTSYKRFPC